MYNTILIPVSLDHLETLPRQVEVAEKLKTDNSRVIAVSVIEEIPAYVAEYAMVRPDTKELLRQAKQALTNAVADYPGIETKLLAGKPGVVIANYAESVEADLILSAASRPGSEGYALGSTASRLVRRAACSVMVVR